MIATWSASFEPARGRRVTRNRFFRKAAWLIDRPEGAGYNTRKVLRGQRDRPRLFSAKSFQGRAVAFRQRASISRTRPKPLGLTPPLAKIQKLILIPLPGLSPGAQALQFLNKLLGRLREPVLAQVNCALKIAIVSPPETLFAHQPADVRENLCEKRDPAGVS